MYWVHFVILWQRETFIVYWLDKYDHLCINVTNEIDNLTLQDRKFFSNKNYSLTHKKLLKFICLIVRPFHGHQKWLKYEILYQPPVFRIIKIDSNIEAVTQNLCTNAQISLRLPILRGPYPAATQGDSSICAQILENDWDSRSCDTCFNIRNLFSALLCLMLRDS